MFFWVKEPIMEKNTNILEPKQYRANRRGGRE